MSSGMIPALNQEKSRRFQRATDQHGRKWGYFLDIKSGDACTQFRPEFKAPWYPAQRAISVEMDRPGAIAIDYDIELRQLREAQARYRTLVIQAANFFNVKDFDPDRDEPTAQMRHDIGPPPLPDTPVRAAKAGNGFVLGLRPFDGNRAGDVKLADALVRWTAPRGGSVVEEEELSEFADDVEEDERPVVEKIPRGRGSRQRAAVG